MANRFTDSGKWDDPWFRKLSCKHKAFWFFLLDKCTHAGIWKVDFESASFHIGEDLTEKEIIDVFNGRIHPFKDKWFIPKFIFFQYGSLSECNRVHKSVIDILEKEGLFKVYRKTLLGLMDMDKDKDKDKDNIKCKELKQKYLDSVLLTQEEYQKLIELFGEVGTQDRIDALNTGIMSKGYKYKSHYHTILSWERKNAGTDKRTVTESRYREFKG